MGITTWMHANLRIASKKNLIFHLVDQFPRDPLLLTPSQARVKPQGVPRELIQQNEK